MSEQETEAHVSEEKKLKVKELAEQMKRRTVMIVSVKGVPSAQFQEIKKKIRGRAKIQIAKKSLVDFALDHSGKKELHELVKYVQDGTAILFSDSDAFEISGILADEKSPSKAKAGQLAPGNIEVKAGPTELLPGPDISALSAVGLAPKVEGGKISIIQDKIIATEGSVITPEIASIMAKLDIIPFEIGLEPIAAFMDGKIYRDIVIDKIGTIENLENSYERGIAFAVDIAYVSNETLDYILGRAGREGNAIESLIEKEVIETGERVKEESIIEERKEVAENVVKEIVENVKEGKEDEENSKEKKSEDGRSLEK